MQYFLKCFTSFGVVARVVKSKWSNFKKSPKSVVNPNISYFVDMLSIQCGSFAFTFFVYTRTVLYVIADSLADIIVCFARNLVSQQCIKRFDSIYFDGTVAKHNLPDSDFGDSLQPEPWLHSRRLWLYWSSDRYEPRLALVDLSSSCFPANFYYRPVFMNIEQFCFKFIIIRNLRFSIHH